MAARGRLDQKGYAYWTLEEMEALREAWPKGGMKEARKALPHRAEDALRGKAFALGLRTRDHKAYENYGQSDFVDAAIKRAYSSGRPGLADLSRRVNRPVGWLKWRAGVLGVRRQLAGGGALWTADEDAILTACSDAGMSVTAMQSRLKKAGFARSVSAVSCRLITLDLGFSREWWTARNVAQVFGIDDHAVIRWIQKGLLRATRKAGNSNRDPDPERLAMYAIRPDDVRKFMVENPAAWDHRRMRKEVLLDLLCPSQLNAAHANRERHA